MGFRGCLYRISPNSPFPLSHIPPRIPYRVFRNRRKVGYRANGRRGGTRGPKVRKSRNKKADMRAEFHSVGFRHVPMSSARFRGAPLCPHPHSPSHRSYISPPNRCQAFRNHRNVGYWTKGGKGETRGPKVLKARKKGRLEGAIPPFWCSEGACQVPRGSARFSGGPLCLCSRRPWFRGVPPGSAAVHCAHLHCSSLLYSARQPIPGVSKPPKRWVLGGERAERAKNHVKKGGFEGEISSYWCSAVFRLVP